MCVCRFYFTTEITLNELQNKRKIKIKKKKKRIQSTTQLFSLHSHVILLPYCNIVAVAATAAAAATELWPYSLSVRSQLHIFNIKKEEKKIAQHMQVITLYDFGLNFRIYYFLTD